MLFVQGCGLGWLYMKIGDSKRISALKLLSFDTQASRFKTAQKGFQTGIGYYKDSILYDEVSNPEVYYKQGFTYLMLTPESRRDEREFKAAAQGAFLGGLNQIRQAYDREKSNKTAEMVRLEQEVRQELQITEDIPGDTAVPADDKAQEVDDVSEFFDETYARLHAGLGQVAFLEAISQRQETSYKVALYHYKLAERASTRRGRKEGKRSMMAKLLNFFNLEEIVEEIPYVVEVAKIHNYMALAYRREGKTKLENYHFGLAKESLDTAKNDFAADTRVYAEDARLAFYQHDYNKALTSITKVLKETDFYADKREFLLLQGQIYNEMKKPDEALQAFQWILDREENAVEALLGRALAFGQKKDRNSAVADVTTILREAEKDPYLLRKVADVYLVLGDRLSASNHLLKAYYIDQEDIELAFRLGKLKLELNELNQARDLLNKVININPASDYATKARELLAQL